MLSVAEVKIHQKEGQISRKGKCSGRSPLHPPPHGKRPIAPACRLRQRFVNSPHNEWPEWFVFAFPAYPDHHLLLGFGITMHYVWSLPALRQLPEQSRYKGCSKCSRIKQPSQFRHKDPFGATQNDLLLPNRHKPTFQWQSTSPKRTRLLFSRK